MNRQFNSGVPSIRERLSKLLARTGFEIIQVNGQRIYFDPSSKKRPRKGCEVFVGKLPHDIYEDELVTLFEKIGEIQKIRLMMDFTGMNRGYAFVTYNNPDVAKMAVSLLNGTEMRPGKKIGIFKSIDNCRLFVGGLPVERTSQEIWNELTKYVDGIQEIIMHKSYENPDFNRGFVFVEFENHRLAAMARRKISPGTLMWGVPILVDWAYPLPELDPVLMSRVTRLYIRNLKIEMTNHELYEWLGELINTDDIVKTHKIKDYAFIHFVTRDAAEEALQTLRCVNMGNEQIEVMWARPKIYSKASRNMQPPNHFCTSLPPIIRKQVINMREKISEGNTTRTSPDVSCGASTSAASTTSPRYSEMVLPPPARAPMNFIPYQNALNNMNMSMQLFSLSGLRYPPLQQHMYQPMNTPTYNDNLMRSYN